MKSKIQVNKILIFMYIRFFYIKLNSCPSDFKNPSFETTMNSTNTHGSQQNLNAEEIANVLPVEILSEEGKLF